MYGISISQAATIAKTHFLITGDVSLLDGDEDFNFKITTPTTSYVLKIATTNLQSLETQNNVLHFLSQKELPLALPQILPNKKGDLCTTITIGTTQYTARLITFVQGRLWATINPKTSVLRHDLGYKAGAITKALLDFTSTPSPSDSHWDLANASWSSKHTALFKGEKRALITRFQSLFSAIETHYKTLPKSTIHADVNDYNCIVSNNFKNPEVAGIIDFGDAIYTQTINDVAITIAYGVMDVPDPLEAALEILKGYSEHYSFTEKELHCLYTLVAMRLVTTVTKAALRTQEDSTNAYHSISEQPAWELLEKWQHIHPDVAEYSFRNSCGFEGHPTNLAFQAWAKNNTCTFSELFPSENLKTDIHLLDYPTLTNPKIIATDMAQGATNGYRTPVAYTDDLGDVYQIISVPDNNYDTHILKISNGDYDASYDFNLSDLLGFNVASNGWFYVGNGIGYVPYANTDLSDDWFNASVWSIARVDVYNKTIH